jgi:two-component system sensor histidine kinase RegB
MFARVSLPVMIENIVGPLRGADVTITTDAAPADDGKPRSVAEPVLARNPAIAYGLSNIIENAADFAAREVTVEARWSGTEVVITVRDDGPGFDQTIIDRLGDPFVTTRKGYGIIEDQAAADQHEGMGLGFFIAKTLLERNGASVALANKPAPDHGAIVRISWPRSRIDAGPAKG